MVTNKLEITEVLGRYGKIPRPAFSTKCSDGHPRERTHIQMNLICKWHRRVESTICIIRDGNKTA
ncbi:hypothetical protein [Brasilonema sp. UFV-L1]|uniref:hypothetical protein n=1 Tax=Brasilonema sp. UFV-L1 TaxID=2234130 RepID=UPI00145F0419|nr:hypothetical protein [Brasilonema sp. UFV-L1]